ncbi:MAG: T9SS type A sorting domain-containing protein [Bacteroidota bacterium]
MLNFKKQRFCTLFCLLFASMFTGTAYSQTISVALPDTFVTETDAVMVPVTVSDVSTLGIISFDMTIAFDPEIIQINNIAKLDGIAAGFFYSNNLGLDGKVAIAAAGVDTLTGAGPLFYLEAGFLKDGSSEMSFDKVNFEVDSLEVEAQNGRLRNISPASVEDPVAVSGATLLSHMYPNPFFASTTLTMDLPETALVSVEVYNLAGQRQDYYPPRPLAAGANQLFNIDASSMPAGSYFYRITAQSQGTTRYGGGMMTIIH